MRKVRNNEEYRERFMRRGVQGKKIKQVPTFGEIIEGQQARHGRQILKEFRQFEGEVVAYTYQTVPHQIGHGMKPEHHRRALTSGFAPLMTKGAFANFPWLFKGHKH